MRIKLTHQLLTALLGVAFTTQIHAQSSAFTYQGYLTQNGAPANGTYDLLFQVHNAATFGTQQGPDIAVDDLPVTNGLFTVTLDFGASVFDGSNRWLNIGVRPGASTDFYESLDPRQPLTATPYAVRAATAASANSVSAANISGTIPLTQLPTTVVTNGASAVNISGTFSGNGAGVTNVNLLYANTQGAINFSVPDVHFVLTSSPSVGDMPRSVTSVDVNGDGHPDLISAIIDADTLTVLTNDGSGGFVLSSAPGVGSGPASVTSADVNGDGHADLISANSAISGNLTVLTNDGSGGFVVSSSPSVGPIPVSVTAADVNGNGLADLISANNLDNTLTVLTNDGGGGFVLSATLGTGNGPSSVTAAEVNGDGYVDLITANRGANTLTVLTNDGSGGFVLSSVPSVGSLPTWVAAADVNGDGHADLVSANSAANTLTVLTNDRLGGFVLSSTPGVGNGPGSVTAADVNGDGRPDLITANRGDTLTVLLNSVHYTAAFVGNGSGLTSLNAGNITGTLDPVRIPDLDASKITTGTLGAAQIPNLDASKISSGTLGDARLSANVALLNRNPQTFTGENVFSGQVGISSSTQFSERLRLSGQEFYQPAHTDTDGLSLLLGVNRLDNRQLWIADSGRLAVNSSNPVVRLLLTDKGAIDSVATDGTTLLPLSLGPNGSLVLSTNGHVGIGTISPQQALDVVGNIVATGTITGSSDRNVKENFAPVDPQEVLERVTAMPIQRWNYIGEEVPHIGPVAQDFHGAFQVGMDDKHISMVDADGVALAAIQGLNQKLEQKETEITELKSKNESLEARLEKLEQLLNQTRDNPRSRHVETARRAPTDPPVPSGDRSTDGELRPEIGQH